MRSTEGTSLCNSWVKREQGWLSRKDIANEHRGKIEKVVPTEAGAGETHLLSDAFEHSRMREHLRKGCHFSQKKRHGRL